MYMNQQLDSKIKVYKDIYAKPNIVCVGYKGKIINPPGIIFCPYKKPSWFHRFINRIVDKFISLFRTKRHAKELIEKTKIGDTENE